MFICASCERSFASKDSLRKHTKIKHTILGPLRQCRIKCPFGSGCENTFAFHNALNEHLKDSHKVEIIVQNFHFQNTDEFEDWKYKIEQDTTAKYVQDSAKQKTLQGYVVRYFCHRSFNKRIIDEQCRKRSLKSQGSNKLEKVCPSRIVARFSESDGIHIEYYATHCGHETAVGKISLSNQERARIAGKLSEGVTPNRILNDVRNEACGETLSRIHLLERQDIYNISRDFNVNHQYQQHENDAVSVKLWVDTMRLQEENPVLYYKNQNETDNDFDTNDFVLIIMTSFQEKMLKRFPKTICIDGTHGLNNYGFQLFTMLVLDDFGTGMPVAFCFSNRSDQKVMEYFFKVIKTKIGSIEASVFMTDDAPMLYNAWEHVMGSVDNVLLCTWHVNRSWTKNLNKITNADKRSTVWKTLQILKHEVSEDKFTIGLNSFATSLLEDAETKQFGDYFVKFYFNRPKKWAYCYRRYIGLHTNMYLESLHKTIKYCYLDGKKCRRLDKSINALLTLVRDKYFERVIRFSKNRISRKINRINKSHFGSLTVLNIIQQTNHIFSVQSTRNKEISYIVERIVEGPTCKNNCEIRCIKCNICVHTFKCTCNDNIINFNICKHIHACVTKTKSEGTDSDANMINHLSDETTVNVYHGLKSSTACQRSMIQQKLELLLGLNQQQDFSENTLKYLDKCITLETRSKEDVSGISNSFVETESVNINKKIQPQLRFKKNENKKSKNKDDKSLNYPSTSESIHIQEQLSGQSSVINIHTGFDHSYSKFSF